MQISPINLVYRPSYTDKGNNYKRSNLGKTAMVATTTAAVLSSAARSEVKDQKNNLKAGGALIAIALMVGTFIDAITNKVSSTIVDNRFSEIQQMKQRQQEHPAAGEVGAMFYHQG